VSGLALGLGVAFFISMAYEAARGEQASTVSIDPLNALGKAIYLEDIPQIRALLKQHPNLMKMRKGDPLSTSLASYTLVQGSFRALKALIEEGVNPNEANEVGVTPLHVAAYHDLAEGCKILLQSGASMTVTNQLGETPIAVAKARGSTQCLAIFAK
jgi:ankyrin repeat protein